MNEPYDPTPPDFDGEDDALDHDFQPAPDDQASADTQWGAPSSAEEHALCELQGQLNSLVFLHDVTTHALKRFRAAPQEPAELLACCDRLRLRLGQIPATNRLERWLHPENRDPAYACLPQFHDFLARCYALLATATGALSPKNRDGANE